MPKHQLIINLYREPKQKYKQWHTPQLDFIYESSNILQIKNTAIVRGCDDDSVLEYLKDDFQGLK